MLTLDICPENDKWRCRIENITYRLTCNQCKDIYIGETCRNAYVRGKEHASQFRKKDKDSVMYRHHEQNNKTDRHETTYTNKQNIKKSSLKISE